ncbi:hypothetical protein JD76_04735 [Micromonospora endolithica]|nr:hypothetical protein JD76_04735 [Micromonospora endolithica]
MLALRAALAPGTVRSARVCLSLTVPHSVPRSTVGTRTGRRGGPHRPAASGQLPVLGDAVREGGTLLAAVVGAAEPLVGAAVPLVGAAVPLVG